VFGAVATGVLATSAVQQAYSGLIDGNAGQVVTQLLAVGATIAYAVVATFIIIKVVDVILGIRVPKAQEEAGLDLAVHGEVAYQM
jgi:Amt family ammonium transporter